MEGQLQISKGTQYNSESVSEVVSCENDDEGSESFQWVGCRDSETGEIVPSTVVDSNSVEEVRVNIQCPVCTTVRSEHFTNLPLPEGVSVECGECGEEVCVTPVTEGERDYLFDVDGLEYEAKRVRESRSALIAGELSSMVDVGVLSVARGFRMASVLSMLLVVLGFMWVAIMNVNPVSGAVIGAPSFFSLLLLLVGTGLGYGVGVGMQKVGGTVADWWLSRMGMVSPPNGQMLVDKDLWEYYKKGVFSGDEAHE